MGISFYYFKSRRGGEPGNQFQKEQCWVGGSYIVLIMSGNMGINKSPGCEDTSCRGGGVSFKDGINRRDSKPKLNSFKRLLLKNSNFIILKSLQLDGLNL